MSNDNIVNFPKRTASELTLPDGNGTKVWIQTLNDVHKRKAYEHAALTARITTKDFRKNGEAREALVAEIEELDKEKQCQFVAQGKLENGDYLMQVETELPEPVSPSRKNDEREEDFIKRQEQFESEKTEWEKNRATRLQELYDQGIEEVKSWSKKKRVEECINRAIMQQFNRILSDNYTLWTVYYATRVYDDHSEFYYDCEGSESIRKIEDEEQNIREAIIAKYRELDSITNEEIPT